MESIIIGGGNNRCKFYYVNIMGLGCLELSMALCSPGGGLQDIQHDDDHWHKEYTKEGDGHGNEIKFRNGGSWNGAVLDVFDVFWNNLCFIICWVSIHGV